MTMSKRKKRNLFALDIARRSLTQNILASLKEAVDDKVTLLNNGSRKKKLLVDLIILFFNLVMTQHYADLVQAYS